MIKKEVANYILDIIIYGLKKQNELEFKNIELLKQEYDIELEIILEAMMNFPIINDYWYYELENDYYILDVDEIPKIFMEIHIFLIIIIFPKAIKDEKISKINNDNDYKISLEELFENKNKDTIII